MTRAVEPGLRERKRVRTRAAIARAALELFDRQGFRETTVQQVADAADVAARTVFHHFPRKEELAFADSDAAFERLAARLAGRPAGETAAQALRAWIVEWLEAEAGRAAHERLRRRVVRADDALRTYEHRYVRRAQELIAAAVAQDLGVAPDALEPRLAAAATLTVLDVLGDDDLAARDDDPMALVDRALRFVDGGIRALRD